MSNTYEEWEKLYLAEVETNYRMFAEQREQIRCKYAGQWIGFAYGHVIVAGQDVDVVIALMGALVPEAKSAAIFRAEDEPVFELVESVSSEFV